MSVVALGVSGSNPWTVATRQVSGARGTSRSNTSVPSRRKSTETPRHAVSSLDHFVTQWMSVRISSLDSARNSSHDHDVGSSTAPVIENVHVSRDTEGVGPADNTGKSSTTYWPGGMR